MSLKRPKWKREEEDEGADPDPDLVSFEDVVNSSLLGQFTKNVALSSKDVKGYKFVCSSSGFKELTCRFCGQQLVGFVTVDVEEAYKHSLENNVPMWIAKDAKD